MLIRREDELLADMKVQVVTRHVDMQRQTVEVVQAAVVGLKVVLVRVEGEGQHFVYSLIDAMNEISQLRCEYNEKRRDED